MNITRRRLGYLLSFSIFYLLVSLPEVCASEPAKYETQIQIPGLSGVLVLIGDGSLPEEAITAFHELAGAGDAHIVVLERDRSGSLTESIQGRLAHGLEARGVSLLKTLFDARLASEPTVLADNLARASGLWIGGGVATEFLRSDEIAGTIRSFFDRGGVMGANPRQLALLTESDFKKHGDRGNGHDLLCGTVLLPGPVQIDAIRQYADSDESTKSSVIVMVDSDTALIMQGRRGHIVGEGEVVFGLAPSHNRPTRIIRKPAGTTVDLIALSRAAVARAGDEFPAKKMRDPVVESGTLFIGGGGQMPEEGMKRFIEISGGPDAIIIVIPTAIGSSRALEFGEQNAQRIRDLGANNVIVMHTMNPREADTDDFCEPFRTAGGIWFTGGRQWNLVDAYWGTQAHELMHDVLKRGGAIGGSSAGASIQAEYMVRGHPLGNTVMMAEGYEKGLDFLPGVGIDQHFAQRDRFADLASVKHAFPQLLCLGIDEQTMLIVTGSIVEVFGPNNLQVYADHVPDDFDGSEYELVKPGQRYDLKLRRKIED